MSQEGWKEQDFAFEATDGIHYDSPADWFWSGVLGFCGCYSQHAFDEALRLLRGLYESRKAENDESPYVYKDVSDDRQSLQEVLLHVFDAKKLIEHGGSVRFGWITEEGIRVAKIVFETDPPKEKP